VDKKTKKFSLWLSQSRPKEGEKFNKYEGATGRGVLIKLQIITNNNLQYKPCYQLGWAALFFCPSGGSSSPSVGVKHPRLLMLMLYRKN
jgi:hypothetical protein